MTGSTQGQGRTRSWPRVLEVVCALVLALVVWGLLVWQAIDAGGRGRDGDDSGWIWLGVCALGAVAALFVALVLGQRLARVWRGEVRSAYAGTHRR